MTARSLQELMLEAAVICGSGSGAALSEMAAAIDDPRAWAMAVDYCQRVPPRTYKRILYFRRVLETSAKDVARLSAAASSADGGNAARPRRQSPSPYLAGPLSPYIQR